MIQILTIIAEKTGALIAAHDAKRRAEQGLPPAPAPPAPTWKDKCADFAFGAVVFFPAIGIAAIVGISLWIVLKIAFAAQGMKFP